MAFRVEHDPEGRYVEAVCSGDVGPEELVAFRRMLYADPLAVRSRRALLDVREAEAHFGFSAIGGALYYAPVPAAETRFRVAMLVATELQYGMGRQYQAIAYRSTVAEVFYDREEALAWLLLPDAHVSSFPPPRW